MGVGVAFGASSAKQKLGDVLVSTKAIDYANVRSNADGSIDYRGDSNEATVHLVSRARFVKNRVKLQVRIGAVLCGPVLLDNRDGKARLLAQFPTAIGGEMEGLGLYSAAAGCNLEWLIVKAICDWADGSKAKEWQWYAAQNAAELVRRMLSGSDLWPDAEADHRSSSSLPVAASSAPPPAQFSNTVHNFGPSTNHFGPSVTHNYAAPLSRARQSAAQSVAAAAALRRQTQPTPEQRATNYERGSYDEPPRPKGEFYLGFEVYPTDLDRNPHLRSIGSQFGPPGYGLPVYFAKGTLGRLRGELKQLTTSYFNQNTDGDYICYKGDLTEKFTPKQLETLRTFSISPTGNVKSAQLLRDSGLCKHAH